MIRPGFQAAIAAPRDIRGFRILPFEEVDDGAHGCVKVIEVQPEEACHLLVRALGIVLAKPADEVVHFRVAPHPGWKALERPILALSPRAMPYVAVDGRGVRPVGLHRNDVEPVTLDQPLPDGRARTVEFARSMARLAEQDDARVTEAVEHGPERRIDLG